MKHKFPSPYRNGDLGIGASRHFHGRTHILSPLRKLLTKAKEAGHGGTTLLVEGPGGSGKVALLDQCWKMGVSLGWNPIDISWESLWHPACLSAQIRGEDVGVCNPDHSWTLTDPVLDTLRRGRMVESFAHKMDQVLGEGTTPLLLLRRKAHYISERLPPSMASVIRQFLHRIESGNINRPVVFIAAGNPLTHRGFQKAGYTFSPKNIKDIGWLSQDEERAIIRDWMVEDGNAQGDTTEWEEAMIKETCGFALFTSSYAHDAAEHLRSYGGIMTDAGLRQVLAKGRKSINFHFNHYIFGHSDHVDILLQCIHESSPNPYLYKSDVIEALISSSCDRWEAEKVFDGYLRYGALVESEHGSYVPPQSIYHAMTNNA